jgi:hypothetical protein
MVWWIDLAIVLVALAFLGCVTVSLWGTVRRLWREITLVRADAPSIAARSRKP